MIKSNLYKLLQINLFCFIASCNAAQGASQVIFKCNASEPTPMELIVSKVGSKFYLDKFTINEASVIDSTELNNVKKSSYHRFLATEHSLVFKKEGSEITLSDYSSEEFDTLTNEKTVTLQKSDKKKYWVCNTTAISKLASIENF
tara:strand:+ start:697 stop:1131 length:435 start_codon:yes stop_codon:yes gene_type:complete